ncbi:MAG: serine--tRNA ligase [Bacteroidota bacterium]|nr:serine--tRNA ligase [Bacteroidota bacterium]
MLTLKQIKENTEQKIELLKIKGFEAKDKIEQIIEFDEKRKSIQQQLDETLAQSNIIAKEIGILFKNKQIVEANEKKKETILLKEQSKNLGNELQEIQKNINELLVEIPNIPHESVQAGKNEDDNEILKQSGEIVEPQGKALPHWDIAVKSDIIDFETGNKITAAGFPLYKGKGAKLQRALISFFLDNASENGYLEVQPPLMVNKNSAYATGQLPDKDGQMYHVQDDDFFLIPTAEVPLTNIYYDTIVKENELPIKIAGYTPCFRREAGSYGKNVRGLNRLHQFDKVEIIQIQHPDKSYDTLEEMKNYIESLIVKLGLPYRILRLCGKDLSFTSALTYDFEVWSSAQKRWLEVSSVSNFLSFQANRMKLRFKDENKKSTLLHTLNGSALALPRIVAAILENYQKEDYIEVPEVLIPYSRFDKIEL